MRCHEPCANGGMTKQQQTNTSLPHHRLIAYRLALELIAQFGRMRISDARCREHARKSLTSCALNLAEGAGRRSRADKSRVYSIALGELCEAAAAVEIDAQLRGSANELGEFYAAAVRLKNVISRLIH